MSAFDSKNIGPNHLVLTMLQTFVWQHCQWHCLQKCFCLKLPNSVRNAKKFLEAMPLAMLPTKSLQHCQDQMIRAITYLITIRIHASIFLISNKFFQGSKSILCLLTTEMTQRCYAGFCLASSCSQFICAWSAKSNSFSLLEANT